MAKFQPRLSSWKVQDCGPRAGFYFIPGRRPSPRHRLSPGLQWQQKRQGVSKPSLFRGISSERTFLLVRILKSALTCLSLSPGELPDKLGWGRPNHRQKQVRRRPSNGRWFVAISTSASAVTTVLYAEKNPKKTEFLKGFL
jgi:hypothetical protein